MIDVNTHEFRVDRIDNDNGTHTIMVDHVQVGPPIPWDDTLTEHMVRQTCLRIQREMRRVDAIPGLPLSPIGPASPTPWSPGPGTIGPMSPETFRIYYGDPLPAPIQWGVGVTHDPFRVTS